jgi:hypothetical protein
MTHSVQVKIICHVLRVSNAMQTLQRELNLLTDGSGNAQKGVLQPHIISPQSLMGALMRTVRALPKDVMFPFPLDKNLAYLSE